MMTDPIADMLTRIRNGLEARKTSVDIPSSRMKIEICKILKEEGYILNFKETDDGKQGILTVDLKYSEDGKPCIDGIVRISKPGRRVYSQKDDIEPVLNGLGINILSTNKGVLTDRQSKEQNVGGEILLKVW
jgi:small subunit ribosomal protein S8